MKINNRQLKRDAKIFKRVSLNAIPSPIDERDYTMSTVGMSVGELPESYECKSVKILNQGTIGSCTSHSIVTNMMSSEKQTNDNSNEYSRGYIYANRHINDAKSDGQVIRYALHQLVKDGTVLQEDFPYNMSYSKIIAKFESEKECLAQCNHYKIENYFRVYSAEEIKTCVMKNGGCVIGVYVYDNFGRDLHKPASDAKRTGCHAMTIVGWKDNKWIVQNSWGSSWGYGGKLYMDMDYPILESWGITRGPVEISKKKSFWQIILEALRKLFKK